MAPNRHRIRQVPIELKAWVNTKQPPLVVPISKQSVSDESYWDWPTANGGDNDDGDVSETEYEEEEIIVDIFSANHMVANLIRESSIFQEQDQPQERQEEVIVPVVISTDHPASYDYWAEASFIDVDSSSNMDDDGKKSASAVPQHHHRTEAVVKGVVQVTKAGYWSDRSPLSSDEEPYWDEQREPLHHPQRKGLLAVIREEDGVSKTYWGEKDQSKVTASDQYWSGKAGTVMKEQGISNSCVGYWEWSSEVKTASDNYWYW